MSSYQADPATRPTKLGRYELIGHLATGGMAEIHLARLAGEAGFEKVVVVKRLLPELVASREFVDMFLAEGKLVSRLDHPNICEVHELGRDGAEYFLVMPFLDGVPVSDLIARPREADRLAELRIAVTIVTQACAGLHHAHELRDPDGTPLGLVHRDVSPSNLFATASGAVKVLDFGIAKVRGAGAETAIGTIKGKTQYMAPEQLLGEPLDRRCDVFALGIVLFELATHQRLFKRPSDYLIAKAILDEPIARADAVDPAIGKPLADAIAKALARKRDDRYPDMRAFAEALHAAMPDLATGTEIGGAIATTEELSTRRMHRAQVIASIATVPARPRPAEDTALITTRIDVAAIVGRRRRRVVGLLALAVIASAVVVVVRLRTPAAVAIVADAAPVAVAQVVVDAAPIAVVDAEVAPDAAPIVVDRRPGLVSIDSTPFAKIAIDGRAFGVTPLLKKSLSAGKHRVHAALADGRTRDVVIDVPPGRAAPALVLTW